MAKWMFKGTINGACWGPRPTKVDLDFQDVQKALAAGLCLGDKVSVRVKVEKRDVYGNRSKLFRNTSTWRISENSPCHGLGAG